jgi:hypothetical protein
MGAFPKREKLHSTPSKVSSGLTNKHYTRLTILSRAKHSSLFYPFISDEEKCFITLTTNVNDIKLYTSYLMLMKIS